MGMQAASVHREPRTFLVPAMCWFFFLLAVTGFTHGQ
jgi:hypothetical protein